MKENYKEVNLNNIQTAGAENIFKSNERVSVMNNIFFFLKNVSYIYLNS